MSSKSSSASRVIPAIARLSETAIKALSNFYIKWLETGRSSLINAYASNIATADFLHSAGLMTDNAYNAIFALSTLTDFATVGAGVWTSIFGNNSLQPVLKSLVEDNDEGDGEEDEVNQAVKLAGAIKLAEAAAEAAL